MSTNIALSLEQAKRHVVEAMTASPLSEADKQAKFSELKQLLKKNDAVLIAHYYTNALLQELAEQSGGYIGDSLEMAKFGRQSSAQTLVVVGVKFMGETAKILSPEKRVLMPTLHANCSLDLGCPADAFSRFCDHHPDRTVVVYANTSVGVKARADWIVTSSVALDIVRELDAQGKKILWAPDKYLGHYIQTQTGADMLMWDGSCIVHETFKANTLRALKAEYPDAAILVHPESPSEVIAMADVVGSTSQLIKACVQLPHKQMIVATERGIFYKMQQAAPDKELIQAPSGGAGATCRSCVHCPWMAMNDLDNLKSALEHLSPEIQIDKDIADKARIPLERLIHFQKQ